jgi:hypothetical protein
VSLQKWLAISAGFAFVLSLSIGLLSGVNFLAALFRAVMGGAVFSGLVYGLYAVVKKYLPELLSAAESGRGDIRGEAPEGTVNIIVDDTPEFAGVQTMLRPRSSAVMSPPGSSLPRMILSDQGPKRFQRRISGMSSLKRYKKPGRPFPVLLVRGCAISQRAWSSRMWMSSRISNPSRVRSYPRPALISKKPREGTISLTLHGLRGEAAVLMSWARNMIRSRLLRQCVLF